MTKKVTVLLPYANPHVLGWVRELRDFNIDLKIYSAKSVKLFVKGYFSEMDDCNDIIYLFKQKQHLGDFIKDLALTDIYITLGIFEKVFLKYIPSLKNNAKVFVLSEPFNPIKSKKYILLRQVITLYLKLINNKMIFLCIGGSDVKSYYNSLGFKKNEFYNFGYFPKLNQLNELNIRKKVRFIFVGQLIERKGIEILINALHFLNDNFNSELWDFKIIGDGTLKRKLVNEISKINNASINFLGVLNDNLKIEKHYTSSDVLFIPSVFDGWGAVVNEALSKNLAILSSKTVYASKSMVKPNFNGFLFDHNNFDEMNKCLTYFFSDNIDLLIFKKNSKLIFEEWNAKNTAKSFVRLIENKKNLNISLLQKI